MKTGYIEQLQLLLTATWDGELISKSDRNELVKADLVQRCNGWNIVTRKGIQYLIGEEC